MTALGDHGRERHFQDVLRGASAALIFQIVGACAGLVFNILLARALGPEGTGVYYLALTVIGIGAVVGRLGLDNAMLRYVAAGAAVEDWGQVAAVHRLGIRIASVALFIAAVAIFFTGKWVAIALFGEPGLAQPLRIMAFALVPLGLLNLYGESLRGLGRIAWATLVQRAGTPVLGALLLGGLWWSTITLRGVALVYVTSTFLVFVLAASAWRGAAAHLRTLSAEFSKQRLIGTALPLLWVASTNLVMMWTDTVVLGVFRSSAEVGLYGVAARAATLTTFALSAINAIAAPKYAALYARGERAPLAELARRTTALMVVVTAPLLLLYVLWPANVLDLFGSGFRESSVVLTILALGQFVNVATGSVGYLLMMSGHEKLMRNNILFSALLNVMMNVALVPRLGMIGAAIGTAISTAVMNLTSMVLVYFKLGFLTVRVWR